MIWSKRLDLTPKDLSQKRATHRKPTAPHRRKGRASSSLEPQALMIFWAVLGMVTP